MAGPGFEFRASLFPATTGSPVRGEVAGYYCRVKKLSLVALLLLSALSATEAAEKRLNFVFILADDLGWRDLGCYGSTFYETPHLDQLAREGMRFTDAYAAAPVCSPTRAAILTGKYPARIGLTDWVGRPAAHPAGEVVPPVNLPNLPLEEYTLAEAFAAAGYTTLFVGKWHLGGTAFGPDRQGFEYSGAVSDRMPYFSKSPSDDLPAEYLTDRLTKEACELLDRHVQGGKPFLLFLSHYAVHGPFEAKKGLIAKYEEKARLLPPVEPLFLPEGDSQARQAQNFPVMAAMIESLDENVGRLLEKLEDLGVAGETAVIFTSDNGGQALSAPAQPPSGPTSNLPLRAGKGHLYEGGIRVPLIIKWPGVVRKGSLSSQPVESIDFYPTLLDMASLPPRPKQHLDGRSFLGILRGEKRLEPRPLYWHYPHYVLMGDRPASAVRSGHDKLIEFLEDGRIELYDLEHDPGERHNLAAQRPERASQLLKLLREWRISVGAHMPSPNPDFKPRLSPASGDAPSPGDSRP